MNIFEQILNEGDLCFDIGANKGSKTDMMLSHGAKVVCVEPQSSCIDVLNEKFINNKNVAVVGKAVGKSSGVEKFFVSHASTLSTMSETFIDKTRQSRFNGIHWNEGIDIETTTLDDLISSHGTPTFCKIDIEGYEVEALKGLNSIIPFISIEFIPELKRNAFECIDILENIGKCSYNYSEAESMEFTFPDWQSKDIIIDFLRKNEDFRVSFGDLYVKMESK